MAMLIDLEEEEMSATALRDSLKPESFPSLNYNIEQENVAVRSSKISNYSQFCSATTTIAAYS